MRSVGERIMVYMALLLLCGLTAVAVSPGAGALSLLQIVMVIELLNWLARPGASGAASGDK